jgi:hypothetical protein
MEALLFLTSTPPRPDPRSEADRYLADKKVMELFHDLGSKLVYAKPADPNQFLVNTLRDLQEGKGSVFFTEKDIETMVSEWGMRWDRLVLLSDANTASCCHLPPPFVGCCLECLCMAVARCKPPTFSLTPPPLSQPSPPLPHIPRLHHPPASSPPLSSSRCSTPLAPAQ